MKLKPLYIVAASALLASCSATPTTTALDLAIACPAGAPAVAFYRYLQGEKTGKGDLEINADPANVVAYLAENSNKDIVVAPTNAGLTAILKKSAPYKIAATLTFGNFFVASTGKDDNQTMDNDDYVVAFQQNNIPDKLFKYCYPELTNVHYVTAASDAAKCLITGKNETDDNAEVKYVLMAEPALTNALSKNSQAYEYASIQEEFAKKSGGAPISQASIFVSNSADQTKVKNVLSQVRSDVEAFLADPNVIDSYVEGLAAEEIQAKYSAPLAALKAMTTRGNRMGLGFRYAK